MPRADIRVIVRTTGRHERMQQQRIRHMKALSRMRIRSLADSVALGPLGARRFGAVLGITSGEPVDVRPPLMRSRWGHARF